MKKKVTKKTPIKKSAMITSLLEKGWSLGELDVLDNMIAEEYTIFNDPGDPWEGKAINLEIYKKRIALARQVFPDLKFTIQELIEAKDKVVVSWFMTGTQKGALQQLPATGNLINVSGLTIYYFKKNKISGHWQVLDRLELIKQLRKTNPSP